MIKVQWSSIYELILRIFLLNFQIIELIPYINKLKKYQYIRKIITLKKKVFQLFQPRYYFFMFKRLLFL